MKAYKLTNSQGETKNNTQWGENVTHSATGTEKFLCTKGWIHFYTNPLIAVLMNSVHADFQNPILWECETEGGHLHEPLKSGCKTLTTIKQIPLPEVTTTQRVAFGILCTKEVYKEEKWNTWADNWLSGKDRTDAAAAAHYSIADGADAARHAAHHAAHAAAHAARHATDYAAHAAAHAAHAAAHAAHAAHAAYYAALCAAAYCADTVIDFIELANKALMYKQL